jgi:uncharacterized protein involved in response to NO
MAFLQRFFSYGFRPFFLLGTLYSIGAIGIWMLIWRGSLVLDWDRVPVFWHGHDMVMGLMAAAMAGFLLTAVANWTSRPPVAGWPLAVLVGCWTVGRLGLHSATTSAIADLLFWGFFTVLIAREVLAVRNKRNYKIVVILALMTLLDGLFHLGELQLLPAVDLRQVLWAQLWLVIVLISVVGGRVIPAFTGNWLRRQHAAGTISVSAAMPADFGKPDMLAIGLLVAFAGSVVLQLPVLLTAPLGLLCFMAQTWRFVRWRFWLTFSDPLVWMMHLSYAWLVTGIALWTLAELALLPVSMAIHALTIGAIASMIVSVAARAALGHTGRALQTHWLLTSAIILLSLAALSRIIAVAAEATWWLDMSAGLWMLAMLCFALRYAPMLLGRSI